MSAHINRGSREVFVSTACLPYLTDLNDKLSAYLNSGLADIELGAYVSVDSAFAYASTQYPARYLVHNYFPPPLEPFVVNLASENKEIRGRSLELAHRAVALSASLGAPFYSLHAGFVVDPIGEGRHGLLFPALDCGVDSSEALDRFCCSLNSLLDQSRSTGVGILIENNACTLSNNGRLLLQTPEEFEWLFRIVGPERAGVLLDTGHLRVSAQTLGFDRMSAVKSLVPFVRAIHVHDNDGLQDTHAPVSPGSWVLDVLRMSALRKTTVIVESRFTNAAALGDHVSWLTAAMSREEGEER